MGWRAYTEGVLHPLGSRECRFLHWRSILPQCRPRLVPRYVRAHCYLKASQPSPSGHCLKSSSFGVDAGGGVWSSWTKAGTEQQKAQGTGVPSNRRWCEAGKAKYISDSMYIVLAFCGPSTSHEKRNLAYVIVP